MLVLALIMISFFAGFYFYKMSLTGKTVSEEKTSWTKAICDEENRCIDVKIYCYGNRVEKIEPSSELIEFSKTNLSEEQISKFC